MYKPSIHPEPSTVKTIDDTIDGQLPKRSQLRAIGTRLLKTIDTVPLIIGLSNVGNSNGKCQIFSGVTKATQEIFQSS